MPQNTPQRPKVMTARERQALRKRREKRRTELLTEAQSLRDSADLLTAGGRTGEVHVRSETQNRFGTIESMLNRAGQFETVASRLADLLGIDPGA